jgi:methylmalonyl-CoA epimerase
MAISSSMMPNEQESSPFAALLAQLRAGEVRVLDDADDGGGNWLDAVDPLLEAGRAWRSGLPVSGLAITRLAVSRLPIRMGTFALGRLGELLESIGIGAAGDGCKHFVLDHVGVAVHSNAAAGGLCVSLGLEVGREETVDQEEVRAAMVWVGDVRLELLEPTLDDSAVGRFLARRGEGLHHIAIRLGVPDGEANSAIPVSIDSLFNRLRAHGVRLAGDRIRTGAGGHRYFFLHPESTGGLLVEMVNRDDAHASAMSLQLADAAEVVAR